MASVDPIYEEVVIAIRAQLNHAQFQVTLLELTNAKLRERIAELEGDTEEGEIHARDTES